MESVLEAFSGTYTIVNKKSGEYRTFKVKRQKDDSKFAPGKRVVSLMTGSDNERSYTGFGFVNGLSVTVWKKKRGGAHDHYANMVQAAFVLFIVSGEEEPTSSFEYCGREYEVKLSKRCRRCDRKLTTPYSLKNGVGPECLKREERKNAGQGVLFEAK